MSLLKKINLLEVVYLYVVAVWLARGSQCQTIGQCGSAPYDINDEVIKAHGIRMDDNGEQLTKFINENVPELYRFVLPHSDEIYDHQLVAQERQRQGPIVLTLFPIRIRVLYDTSFATQHPDKQELEDFVRVLLFSTQLIFEQPEFKEKVKIQIVVVNLDKLEKDYPSHYNADEMLDHIEELKGVEESSRNIEYDLTLVLLYRNMFAPPEKHLETLLGVAAANSFCNPERAQRGLLVNAYTLSTAYTIAHELAHTLGVQHDGSIEAASTGHECPVLINIMSPHNAPGMVHWSNCSTIQAYNYITIKEIFKCIYNQTRMNLAIPIKPEFDWRSSQGRRILPGQEISLKGQCQKALGKQAEEYVQGVKYIPRDEVCHKFLCKLHLDFIAIGQAIPGSYCISNQSLREGICINSECFVKETE